MEITQHTPGPWHIFVSKKGQTIVVADDEKMPEIPWHICEVRKGASYGDKDPIIANAALISAAPELLASLQELLPIAKHFIKNHEFVAIERAKAAIEKATNINF